MKSLKNINILLIISIYLYVVIQLVLNDKVYYSNIINIFFWLGVLIYFILDIKKNYIRFCKNTKYFIVMVILSSIYTIIYFYIGFIVGFSKSPYNHELFTIIKNVILKIIPIIGIEITRNVIATKNKKNNVLLVILTTILIFSEINYDVFIDLFTNKEELFKYTCSTIIPIVVNNILYTYLSINGSYILVLIYRFYKEITIIMLPILPNINWFLSGTLNMFSAIIIYIVFKYKFIKKITYVKNKKQIIFEQVSYLITISIGIILTCFMLGMYKYELIAIVSDSMTPSFSRGDVVIFKKLKEQELSKLNRNDIIVYNYESKTIVHRIVKKTTEKNAILYKTKGDKNNFPDMKLVKTEQIRGMYVFHIKYIGYPSIWLYEYFNK